MNQEYDEPLEDGDEEILEDQIIDDHQDYPTRGQLGSNRWHDELLEDTMMSMTSSVNGYGGAERWLGS